MGSFRLYETQKFIYIFYSFCFNPVMEDDLSIFPYLPYPYPLSLPLPRQSRHKVPLLLLGPCFLFIAVVLGPLCSTPPGLSLCRRGQSG